MFEPKHCTLGMSTAMGGVNKIKVQELRKWPSVTAGAGFPGAEDR